MPLTSISFLRPLPAPKPAFVRAFLRRATTTTESTSPSQSAHENTSKTFIPAAPPISSEPLTYYVDRTASKQLPVYHLAKRGGNLHQTRIRRISGNILDLKRDLQRSLRLDDERIKINQLTQQIIIKGWIKHDVARFLRERKL